MKWVARRIRWAGALILSLALLHVTGVATPLSSPIPVAHALCASPSPDLSGTWRNTDPNTRGIVTAQLRFVCNDTRLCAVQPDGSVQCTEPFAGYELRLFGACSPTPCDWGWVRTQQLNVFGLRYLSASYDQGFARRSVLIPLSSATSSQITISVGTTFTDGSGRASYTISGTFRRG